MSNETQLDFVEKKIGEWFRFFSNKRDYNRNKVFIFTIVPASLSALTTVSIGVSEKMDLGWLIVVALISSGIATVLGAWESLFSNRKLWVVNNATLAELEELQLNIEYRKRNTAAITQNEIDNYYKKLIQIKTKAEKALQSAYSAK